MKNLFMLLLCCCLLRSQTAAQAPSVSLAGLVLDTKARGVAVATVSLTSNTDTALRSTKLTDTKGYYLFTGVRPGHYALRVSFVGFARDSITDVLVKDTNAVQRLPPMVLQETSGQSLRAVTVLSTRPLIEQKIDRTVVNVDAMLSAAGGNAVDVLTQSPGVMVNDNGNISLNGKSNVLVLIDDRPVYMSGQDLAAYLRALPAGLLDKVELISNPPARYDAAGNAIINIIFKKNRARGLNGSINAAYNQGVYARTNNAINANYRSNKYNIFGNVGYSYDKNYSKEDYQRYFYQPNGLLQTAVLQNSFYRYQSGSYNARLGMDYFLSPRTTWGIVLTGASRQKTDGLQYRNDQYDSLLQPGIRSVGYNSGRYPWNNEGVNVNYQQKLDSAGSLVTASTDYLRYRSSGEQASPLVSYNPDGTVAGQQTLYFSYPSSITIYAGKIDYTHPLDKKAEFSAGLKSSHSSTDAASDWFNDVNGSRVPDYAKTNHFRYTENITSAYINYRKEWTRLAVQAGLRMEHTATAGHQFSNPVITDSVFSKQYSSFFPSLYFTYKLDSAGNHTLLLNFSRRVSRPNYSQVNPFLSFIDPYTYASGNPGLHAAFAQYIELRYNYRQYAGLTLSYGGGDNGINPLSRQVGDSLITRPVNFINNRLFGLIPFVAVKPFPWWSLQLNAVLLFQRQSGQSGGVEIRQQANVHEIETFNRFQLSKSWSAELTGFFPGKQSYGQSRSGAIYSISGGLRVNILHNNGTLRLAMDDIFRTLPVHRQTTGISHVAVYSYRETDSRRVGLSFMYRFGKIANARKRSDNGSAEDEKGRAN